MTLCNYCENYYKLFVNNNNTKKLEVLSSLIQDFTVKDVLPDMVFYDTKEYKYSCHKCYLLLKEKSELYQDETNEQFKNIANKYNINYNTIINKYYYYE
jgi:hypothetical protein